MAINPNIKRLFVLMLENRSYDNLLGWCDLRGWTPDGQPTQADGLVGKSMFSNLDRNHSVHHVGPGAVFSLNEDPGHEFSDVLIQLCGCDNLEGVSGDHNSRNPDALSLTNGVYPPFAIDSNNTGFACCIDDHNQDVASVIRCFAPEQVPVLHFLASQFAVCDHWFSSMPGPTWPNRFFALAGTSWGLDNSPSNLRSIESQFFDGLRFGNGSDSLLTRLAPNEWLVAFGDTAQSWSFKGVDENGRHDRFIDHNVLLSSLHEGTLEDPGDSVKFVFVEPAYDAPGNFKNGNSMHPLGDVRAGEKLIKDVYEALRDSKYWEESALLVVFDEHGGFFDHVLPNETVVPDRAKLEPTVPTDLTLHNFRFDRYGVRVPAIIVSPYVRQGTIDHTFYDHVSIAKTLADIARTGATVRLLDTPRYQQAASFSGVFTLGQPRAAADIPPCPDPYQAPGRKGITTLSKSARALLGLEPPTPPS